MKRFEFSYYDKDEFSAFLISLPNKQRAKFAKTISKVEDYGFYIASRQKWTKKIEGYINLLEVRSKFSSDIIRALYFHSSNGKYVITHGFVKKGQKTPLKEIDKALYRRKIYEDKYGVK